MSKDGVMLTHSYMCVAVLCIYKALENGCKPLECGLNRAGVWYMLTEVAMLMHSCVCMAICVYVDFFRVYMWLLIVV